VVGCKLYYLLVCAVISDGTLPKIRLTIESFKWWVCSKTSHGGYNYFQDTMTYRVLIPGPTRAFSLFMPSTLNWNPGRQRQRSV